MTEITSLTERRFEAEIAGLLEIMPADPMADLAAIAARHGKSKEAAIATANRLMSSASKAG